MRIIVTGATGFIGAKFVEFLTNINIKGINCAIPCPLMEKQL